MKKLLWLAPLCVLLLCACNPGDTPLLNESTATVNRHAEALEKGDFDAATFKEEMGWAVKRLSDHGRQPASDRSKDGFKEAMDRLVKAAEGSENEEARKIVADICHVLQERVLTDAMKKYREDFDPPTEEEMWWSDATPPSTKKDASANGE